jgi:hypothetical protein
MNPPTVGRDVHFDGSRSGQFGCAWLTRVMALGTAPGFRLSIRDPVGGLIVLLDAVAGRLMWTGRRSVATAWWS